MQQFVTPGLAYVAYFVTFAVTATQCCEKGCVCTDMLTLSTELNSHITVRTPHYVAKAPWLLLCGNTAAGEQSIFKLCAKADGRQYFCQHMLGLAACSAIPLQARRGCQCRLLTALCSRTSGSASGSASLCSETSINALCTGKTLCTSTPSQLCKTLLCCLITFLACPCILS